MTQITPTLQTDGWWNSTALNNFTADVVYAGQTNYHGLFRFGPVNVPQGATINTAVLSLFETGGTQPGLSIDLHAQLVDDAPALSAQTDYSALTLTTASTAFPNNPQNGFNLNITSVLQEIVDQTGTAGWVSGGYVLLVADPNADADYINIEAAEVGTNPAVLTITYTGGAAEAVTDGIALGDSVTAAGPSVTRSDGVALGDSVAAQAAYSAAATDGIALGDSVAATAAAFEAITDGIALGDSVQGGVGRSATDGIALGDSVALTWPALGTGPSGALVDSFVQTADDQSLSSETFAGGYAAQSWRSSASPGEIREVTVRMRRNNAPTGFIGVAIRAETGVYGTSSEPTGVDLVVSAFYDVASIATGYTDYTFPLTGWTPDPSTDYTLLVDFRGVEDDGTNNLSLIIESGAEATHGGNFSSSTDGGSSWTPVAGTDVAFAVYELADEAVTDGLALGDSVQALGAYTRSITDGVALGDSVEGSGAAAEAVTDGLVLGESVSFTAAYPRAITDGVALGDSALGSTAIPRTVTDGILLGEDIDTTWTTDSGPDGILLGDSVVGSGAATEAITDGIALGDSVVGSTAIPRAVTDGILLGESIATTWTTDSGPDGILLGDSVAAQAAFTRSVSDGVALGDAASALNARSVTDGVALGDAVTALAAWSRAVSDGLALGDAAAFTASYPRPITDGIALGDSASTGIPRTATDGIALGDSVARVAGYVASVTDGLTLGDGVTAQASGAAAVTDGLALGDSVVVVGAFPRSISDGLLLGDSVSGIDSSYVVLYPPHITDAPARHWRADAYRTWRTDG